MLLLLFVDDNDSDQLSNGTELNTLMTQYNNPYNLDKDVIKSMIKYVKLNRKL